MVECVNYSIKDRHRSNYILAMRHFVCEFAEFIILYVTLCACDMESYCWLHPSIKEHNLRSSRILNFIWIELNETLLKLAGNLQMFREIFFSLNKIGKQFRGEWNVLSTEWELCSLLFMRLGLVCVRFGSVRLQSHRTFIAHWFERNQRDKNESVSISQIRIMFFILLLRILFCTTGSSIVYVFSFITHYTNFYFYHKDSLSFCKTSF